MKGNYNVVNNRIENTSSGPLLEEETVAYARKSNQDKGGAKSIKDQNDVNMETADEYGLPLAEHNLLCEEPGHGGDEYWAGFAGSGLEGDNAPRTRTRPILTEIMHGVVAGRIKCIVVWSLCRLWRDVSICNIMIEVLSRYGCRLYDRNGEVDISTPEGRQSVRSNAVAAQNMREMAAVNSPRGISKSLKRSKLCVGTNKLGVRSVGGASGEVVHIPEEHEMVRALFREFDQGGTVDSICRRLTDEGYQWLTDINKPDKPKGTPTTAVHRQTIRNLLTDVRYQGMQRYKDKVYPAPTLLYNGEPIVPVALFERVQAKLRQTQRGAPSQAKTHPLAGRMRCGLCGQSMRAHRTTNNLPNGQVRTWYTWKALRYCVESWCTHELPVTYVEDVDTYVANLLAPLLLAELRERVSADDQAEMMNRRAVLLRELREAERQLCEELPGFMGHVSPQMLGNMERKLNDQVADLKKQLRLLDARLKDDNRYVDAVANFADVNDGMRRDALRAVIRWAAVIPSDLTRTRNKAGKWETSDDAGRMVFLSAWGTLHTAVIERQRREGDRYRRCWLRPATLDECVGSFNDLPEPAAFYAGLERACKNRRYDFSADEVAPGYTPGKKPPIAEFDV